MADAETPARAFKTAWFAKVARKALIGDEELCRAFRELLQGQANDLGGGVFKKRLDKNRSRSIVLAKSGSHWVYAYLFAKKDRENIDDRELLAFRKLATAYAQLDDEKLGRLLGQGDFVEICHDRQVQVQE